MPLKAATNNSAKVKPLVFLADMSAGAWGSRPLAGSDGSWESALLYG